jgi:hypothetical protein
MSVTAKELSKAGMQGKDLDAVAGEQLRIIDDKLLRADRTWGRNVLAYDLPVALGLPGLSKKDAQRIIYSTILRSLEGRGFETRILLETDRTTIYIVWTTDLNNEEVAAMDALIRTRRINRDAVQDFCSYDAETHRAGRPKTAPAPPPEGGPQQAPVPAGITEAEAELLGAAGVSGRGGGAGERQRRGAH